MFLISLQKKLFWNYQSNFDMPRVDIEGKLDDFTIFFKFKIFLNKLNFFRSHPKKFLKIEFSSNWKARNHVNIIIRSNFNVDELSFSRVMVLVFRIKFKLFFFDFLINWKNIYWCLVKTCLLVSWFFPSLELDFWMIWIFLWLKKINEYFSDFVRNLFWPNHT